VINSTSHSSKFVSMPFDEKYKLIIKDLGGGWNLDKKNTLSTFLFQKRKIYMA
jgi:hypothetical protein